MEDIASEEFKSVEDEEGFVTGVATVHVVLPGDDDISEDEAVVHA